MKKRFVPVLCAVMTVLLSAGCQSKTPSAPEVTEEPVQESQAEQPETAEESTMDELCLKIGKEVFEVRWENNESVEFLKEAVKDEPLTVELSMYGGFEQVGSLGMNVPRNDSDTVTQSGDIVLYSGNQIVVFYGSNSWAYTRLGYIENKSHSELRDLLGNGDVTLTLFNGASASFSVPDVTLNSGYTMPVLGLGTWTLNDAEAENSVYHALKSGMRLIDTARYYRCEKGVGNGIRKAIGEGFVTREEIFVTSKIMPSDYERAYQGIHDSLQDLGLDYIDLMLIHQPGSNDEVVYRALEQAVEEGIVRSIGISNYYTREQVDEVLSYAKITPAVIQNENHLYYQNDELQEYVTPYGSVIESWYPFGGRGHTQDHFGNETIVKIAEAHGKTPAQIILRWQVQTGYITIPGSSNPDHIAENADIFDFCLCEEEMAEIKALDRNERYENW